MGFEEFKGLQLTLNAEILLPLDALRRQMPSAMIDWNLGSSPYVADAPRP